VNLFFGRHLPRQRRHVHQRRLIAGNGTLDVAATASPTPARSSPAAAGAIGHAYGCGQCESRPDQRRRDRSAERGQPRRVRDHRSGSTRGNLNVTPINGYVPANGDTLTPLTYASRTGTVYVPGTWLPTYNPDEPLARLRQHDQPWIGTTGN